MTSKITLYIFPLSYFAKKLQSTLMLNGPPSKIPSVSFFQFLLFGFMCFSYFNKPAICITSLLEVASHLRFHCYCDCIFDLFKSVSRMPCSGLRVSGYLRTHSLRIN